MDRLTASNRLNIQASLSNGKIISNSNNLDSIRFGSSKSLPLNRIPSRGFSVRAYSRTPSSSSLLRFSKDALKIRSSHISFLASDLLALRTMQSDPPYSEVSKKKLKRLYVKAMEESSSDQATTSSNLEIIEPNNTNASITNSILSPEEINNMDSPEKLRAALMAAELRAFTAQNERKRILQSLVEAEEKVKSFEHRMEVYTEEAMAEVRSAKDTFMQELEKLENAKLDLEAKLLASKQESIELAIKVEKMAGIAAQEANAIMAEEAKLRMAEVRTEIVKENTKNAEKMRIEAEKAAETVILEAKSAIGEALAAADIAKDQAKVAEAALKERSELLDNLSTTQAELAVSQEISSKLEARLKQTETTISNLRFELKAALSRAESAESRIAASEAAVEEIEAAASRTADERHATTQKALQSMKAASSSREEAATLALKAEIESLRMALEVSEKADKLKEQSMERRFKALEHSLSAAENSAKAWQERAMVVEELLLEVKNKGLEATQKQGDIEDILNRGRMDVMIGDRTLKWKLLAEGPRRERPDWLKRKALAEKTRLPPLKVSSIDVEVESTIPLELPNPEEVWSIFDSQAIPLPELEIEPEEVWPVLEIEVKPSVQEVAKKEMIEAKAKLDQSVDAKKLVEKELEKAKEKENKILEEQREQLEKALLRKPLKRGKTPDELEDKMEPGTGSGREIVLQGFNWESHRRKWYLEVAPKASDLSSSGITTIWLPPPTQSVSPQGYMPTDLYNLNSAYGTVDELKFCIEEMHKCDILVLGDVVLNHRCAAKQGKDGIWNIFGGKLAWGPEAIVRDDPNFHGRGNASSGDIFHAAPNIDHAQDFVRKDIKEWLNWLRNEIGYDGWRLDFVRGFWGGHVKEYIESSNPAFCIGEYWDSLGYEGGNVSYNQDAHRQRIINWINATGGTSSAFDVTTKGILHSALHNEYWRLIDPQGKPPGVMGWWPSRAVTFLENHDTGSTQGHWPFPRDKLMQGYAYILTHPGTPVVFYDHFYDFGLHDQIAELISARNRAGIHCRSTLKIFHANAQGYVAQSGDNLVLKLGHFDWNPSKQNNLVGEWNRIVDHGNDYQIWLKR